MKSLLNSLFNKVRKFFSDMTLGKFFLIILIIGFYWFQVRPAFIRSSCSPIAERSAQNVYYSQNKNEFKSYADYLASGGIYRMATYEYAYNKCLHSKGL